MRGKALKRIGAGLLVVSLLGLASAGERLQPKPAAVLPAPAGIPPAVSGAIGEAVRQGDTLLGLDMVAENPAEADRLGAAVRAAGGQVLEHERTFVRAQVPPAAAESVTRSARVVAVDTNRTLSVAEPRSANWNEVLPEGKAGELSALNLDAVGAREFRDRYGVQGRGVKVAVIDSGIDPGHPDLQSTSDGRTKIVDWKDFTGEGQVEMVTSVPWGPAFTAPGGREYRLPPLPTDTRGARFGYWDEFSVSGLINRDLDRNGSQTDRFGVLLLDPNRPGVYDTVYVDSNNNGDFTDETPLNVYRTNQEFGRLGAFREGRLAALRLNFVVSDIDPAGKWVAFGFDGLGHGTQVAGVLGASNPAGGYTGVAPGVQLLALKAIRSTGEGSWFGISSAIKYAAEQGAAIVNVSIGGLAAVSRFDSGAAERLNQIARDNGVLIVLAADNTGPGLSSGTMLGSSAEVISVGAFYTPAMYKRDFGWVVPSEGVYWRSGMGPRADGSYLPHLVAPGGSPTTSPRWLHNTGYTIAGGTSIATPHVSGAAALLMEAGRAAGDRHDRLSIKRAMEMGAHHIAGIGTAEQGFGLVYLADAFERLQQINSLPALTASSKEGNGGLLARSYTPGGTEFWLTNQAPELARFNVVSSESWLRTASNSLTLPTGVPRRLALQIDPPQEPGIHSAFLTVLQQDKYGPSMTLPVTYIRPLTFEAGQDYKRTAFDRLEVARYRRYFYSVEPGTAAFTVSSRVLSDVQGQSSGTVQVHVFRPDGQAVYQSSEIGARGTGLTSLFQTSDPVEGVWEVVVTAIPDNDGSNLEARYSVEAQVRPGPLGGTALRFSQGRESTVTQPLRVVNTLGPFTGQVTAVGLGRTDASLPWRVVHQLNLVDDFTLTEFAGVMRVEIDNPIPGDVDLDLQLYHQDATAVSGYSLIGQSTRRGSSREAIELPNLPAGRYQVFVIANGNVPDRVQFQYRRLVGTGGYQTQVTDTPRKRDPGESWTPSLSITAPSSPGRYFGYVMVRDTERSQTLSWLPFEVSVGQPELAVEAYAAQLTDGRPSTLTLALRSARDNGPVDGTLTVNGVRYSSRNGEATVTLVPQAPLQTLRVQADVPGYRFVNKEITLRVQDAWAPHPVGVETGEENPVWRRKLISQSP